MAQRDPAEPVIRLIKPDDSIEELTHLLHRSYAALAERGMRFVASHQNEAKTRHRISRGECYLAIHEGKIIGTIIWRAATQTNGTPWYDRPTVSSFGQFAVEPAWQQRGIGSRLLTIAEQRAATTGATELALDTAESADDLIRYYNKRGYRFIAYAKWDVVNYRSVILSKRIGGQAMERRITF
jgi:GNAT superfamily N-acetyltransferase